MKHVYNIFEDKLPKPHLVVFAHPILFYMGGYAQQGKVKETLIYWMTFFLDNYNLIFPH